MTFEDLGLNHLILKAINDKGYKELTKIQSESIKGILDSRDILACAHTGSGKTAAFALPILESISRNILESGDSNDIQALILAPSRELAIQIAQSFESYAKYLEVKIGLVFGGITPKRHIKVLKKNPNVLVATPGRLLDLMAKGYVNLNKLETFVLDEADQMLDSKTRADVHMIIDKLPQKRQNLLFSATMPNGVLKLTKSILNNPLKIDDKELDIKGADIDQSLYLVSEVDKMQVLIEIIKNLKYESIIIFTRTKKRADKACKLLNIQNIRSKALHGDKSQSDRMKSLELFKNKEVKILVATDVAARGIDIKSISHVINLDIPSVAQTYIHRIGRTARAGRSGVAISFSSEDEKVYIEAIEKIQGKIKVINR